MSCAGIFGSECTKTVVMEHHRMNGSSEVLTCPPANLRASHKPDRSFVSDGNQRWSSGIQDQKSKKTAMDLSSNSGNEDPGQAVIPFLSSRNVGKIRTRETATNHHGRLGKEGVSQRLEKGDR